MNGQTWVSQSHGIHPFDVGWLTLHVDVDRAFFSTKGANSSAEESDGQDFDQGSPPQLCRETDA